MTDEDFRFHVLGSLTRIAEALERLAPPVTIRQEPVKLDLSALTTMNHGTREKLGKQWEAEDRLRRFEQPS